MKMHKNFFMNNLYMNINLFAFYLFITVFVKIIFSITFLHISFYKLFYSDKKEFIDEMEKRNDNIEWLFFVLVFLLMIYLFNPSKKYIVIKDHIYPILFTCGIIGLYHQLQEKDFFNLLQILHVK